MLWAFNYIIGVNLDMDMDLISKLVVALVKAEEQEALSIKFTADGILEVKSSLVKYLGDVPVEQSLGGADRVGLHNYILDVIKNLLGELEYPSIMVIKTTGSSSTRNLEFYSEELDTVVFAFRYVISEPIPECLRQHSALKKPNRFARLRRDELSAVWNYIIPFKKAEGKVSPELVLGNLTEEEKDGRLLKISKRFVEEQGEKRLLVINKRSTCDSGEKHALVINKRSRVENVDGSIVGNGVPKAMSIDETKIQRSSIFSSKDKSTAIEKLEDIKALVDKCREYDNKGKMPPKKLVEQLEEAYKVLPKFKSKTDHELYRFLGEYIRNTVYIAKGINLK